MKLVVLCSLLALLVVCTIDEAWSRSEPAPCGECNKFRCPVIDWCQCGLEMDRCGCCRYCKPCDR
uniref:Venom peptide U7-SYTX-Sth1a n=1 Tax=Scytodes thoracica TaxID=1112478 RepID=A0A0A0V5R9_SCYTH|nr:venom peptide U7-SYTX-Sth1a [Scytodes thoracica]